MSSDGDIERATQGKHTRHQRQKSTIAAIGDSPWVPLYMDIDTPSSSRELHRPLPVASNPQRNLRRMSTKEAHEEAESESKAIPTTTATSQSSQVVNNISSSSGGTAGCPPTLERSPKRRKLRVMNTEEALAEAFK